MDFKIKNGSRGWLRELKAKQTREQENLETEGMAKQNSKRGQSHEAWLSKPKAKSKQDKS